MTIGVSTSKAFNYNFTLRNKEQKTINYLSTTTKAINELHNLAQRLTGDRKLGN